MSTVVFFVYNLTVRPRSRLIFGYGEATLRKSIVHIDHLRKHLEVVSHFTLDHNLTWWVVVGEPLP